MVGAMYQHVTVHAVAPIQLGSGSSRGQRSIAIHRGEIASLQIGTAVELGSVVAAVAVLAQPGCALFEQGRVHGSVRRMAIAAIVRHRAVLPQERAALFGVAAVAGLIDRALDQQVVCR